MLSVINGNFQFFLYNNNDGQISFLGRIAVLRT